MGKWDIEDIEWCWLQLLTLHSHVIWFAVWAPEAPSLVFSDFLSPLLVSSAAISFPSMSMCELYWLTEGVIPSHQMCFVPPFSSPEHLLSVSFTANPVVWDFFTANPIPCFVLTTQGIWWELTSTLQFLFLWLHLILKSQKSFEIKRIFRNQKPSYV